MCMCVYIHALDPNNLLMLLAHSGLYYIEMIPSVDIFRKIIK
jgi:hypothetical protein